jgi:hypothetical protein
VDVPGIQSVLNALSVAVRSVEPGDYPLPHDMLDVPVCEAVLKRLASDIPLLVVAADILNKQKGA